MSDLHETGRRGPRNDPAPILGAAQMTLLWIAKLVAAGLLGYHGVLKLIENPADVALFEMIGMEPAGRYVIGVLELLSAALVLIPQSALFGAFLGFGIMMGAIIGHLSSFGLHGIWWAILVAAACVTILYVRRHDAKFIRHLWDR